MVVYIDVRAEGEAVGEQLVRAEGGAVGEQPDGPTINAPWPWTPTSWEMLDLAITEKGGGSDGGDTLAVPIVVFCATGARAALAVEMLLKHGFTDVSNGKTVAQLGDEQDVSDCTHNLF